MRKLGKKAQTAGTPGTQVAAIILVIAVFMVLYILLIPPGERAELLGTNDTNENSITSTSAAKLELLAESPGILTPTTESATVHRIPSVNVFLKVEPRITTLADNIVVINGLFSSSSPKLRFTTEDLDESKKVSLFFSVDSSDGELRVKVNGNTIYSNEIEAGGVQIIEIAKSNLEEENELELSVSGGLITPNKYILSDVGIKQEFERSNVQEIRAFNILPQEKASLTDARLVYNQICNLELQGEFTELEIFLNDEKIYSAETRCITTEVELEVDPNMISSGQNELKFRLEEGDFSFTNLKLETETREVDRPTYFFTLSQKQFNNIQDGSKKINLHILLEQSAATKQARLLINNNEVLMQTDRSVFDRDLQDFVAEGTNFIKIIPVNSFNMIGLKVYLE